MATTQGRSLDEILEDFSGRFGQIPPEKRRDYAAFLESGAIGAVHVDPRSGTVTLNPGFNDNAVRDHLLYFSTLYGDFPVTNRRSGIASRVTETNFHLLQSSNVLGKRKGSSANPALARANNRMERNAERKPVPNARTLMNALFKIPCIQAHLGRVHTYETSISNRRVYETKYALLKEYVLGKRPITDWQTGEEVFISCRADLGFLLRPHLLGTSREGHPINIELKQTYDNITAHHSRAKTPSIEATLTRLIHDEDVRKHLGIPEDLTRRELEVEFEIRRRYNMVKDVVLGKRLIYDGETGRYFHIEESGDLPSLRPVNIRARNAEGTLYNGELKNCRDYLPRSLICLREEHRLDYLHQLPQPGSRAVSYWGSLLDKVFSEPEVSEHLGCTATYQEDVISRKNYHPLNGAKTELHPNFVRLFAAGMMRQALCDLSGKYPESATSARTWIHDC